MPRRIQRKRIRGWRMPDNAVSITRPGTFGNPFTESMVREWGLWVTEEDIREQSIDAFREWLIGDWQSVLPGAESDFRRRGILHALPSIRGKDLACFCREGLPCHGDVLLELANGVLKERY